MSDRLKELAQRIKCFNSETIPFDEVKSWPEGELDELVSDRALEEIELSKTVVCDQCPDHCTIEPERRTIPQTGEVVGFHVCREKPDGERQIIKLERFRQWRISKAKLIELGYYEESGEENINKNLNSLYLGLNLAERTVIVGEKTYNIRSEKVWAFFKELAHDRKQRQVTKRMDGPNDWKNARDMFRRQLQKDFGKEGGTIILRRMIPSSKGCYTLDNYVEVKGGGQVGIRRTKSKQQKPGVN